MKFNSEDVSNSESPDLSDAAGGAHVMATIHHPIYKGVFCDCDDGRKARDFPDGTKVMAEARLCFHNQAKTGPEFLNFVYLKDDRNLYITYTFVLAAFSENETWIQQEFCLTSDGGGMSLLDLEKMLNSASNCYPWDSTHVAVSERESVSYCTLMDVGLVNNEMVAIELGKSSGNGGSNYIMRFLEPDDPDYVHVMLRETAGTGYLGKHLPPESL